MGWGGRGARVFLASGGMKGVSEFGAPKEGLPASGRGRKGWAGAAARRGAESFEREGRSPGLT